MSVLLCFLSVCIPSKYIAIMQIHGATKQALIPIWPSLWKNWAFRVCVKSCPRWAYAVSTPQANLWQHFTQMHKVLFTLSADNILIWEQQFTSLHIGKVRKLYWKLICTWLVQILISVPQIYNIKPDVKPGFSMNKVFLLYTLGTLF